MQSSSNFQWQSDNGILKIKTYIFQIEYIFYNEVRVVQQMQGPHFATLSDRPNCDWSCHCTPEVQINSTCSSQFGEHHHIFHRCYQKCKKFITQPGYVVQEYDNKKVDKEKKMMTEMPDPMNIQK